MFALTGIEVCTEGTPVITGITLDCRPAAVTVIAGGDGAGKTTLCRVAAGLVVPDRGTVTLDGLDLTGRPPHMFARAGIALASADTVNGSLSVWDNLALAVRYGAGVRGRGLARQVAGVWEWFPDLECRKRQPAMTLSSGQRTMLSIARAWCLSPRVLILDEPATGLAPDTLGRVELLVGAVGADAAVVIADTEPRGWKADVVVALEGAGDGECVRARV